MSEIAAEKTHYMPFAHPTSGLAKSDFTVRIFKNGALSSNTAFTLREIAPNNYFLSFDNDGTDFSNWAVILFATDEPDLFYVESWQVRKLTVETDVRQVRARLDALKSINGNSNNR